MIAVPDETAPSAGGAVTGRPVPTARGATSGRDSRCRTVDPLARISRDLAARLEPLRFRPPVAHVYHPLLYAREDARKIRTTSRRIPTHGSRHRSTPVE